jgi:microcystin-dependent protein
MNGASCMMVANIVAHVERDGIAMENYLGQIMAVAFEFTPKGWAQCNGQLLPISENTALFSLLGTMFGGDGRTTFGLPDLRGRAAIGTIGLPGDRGGSETVTLTASQMAAHSHGFAASGGPAPGGRTNPPLPAQGNQYGMPAGGAAIYSAPVGLVGLVSDVQYAGGSHAHDNMQPYIALNYIIALQGIYPSRS